MLATITPAISLLHIMTAVVIAPAMYVQISSPGDAGLNPDLTPQGLERRCSALLITCGVTCFHFDNDTAACESVLKHLRAVAEAPYK